MMQRLARRTVGAAALLVLLGTSCSHGSNAARPEPSSTTGSAPPGTTLAPVAVPTVPHGTVSVVPSDVPKNCSVDVTRQLQAWVDATPDNATLLFARKGCYRIDETLHFDQRHNLLVDGNGATLRAFARGTRNRAHVLVQTSDNVTIQDLTVHGANPHAGVSRGSHVAALEAQAGFQISGSSRVMLQGVAASDVYGDFVYIGPLDHRPSHNVTVSRSRFARSGRQGISITSAANVMIADNTISGAPLSLIDLEANSRSDMLQHIAILRNVTGSAHDFWLADKGANATIGDVEISDNRMMQPTGGLIFVYGDNPPLRGPFVIDGNQFIASNAVHDEGSKGAFFFANATGVTLHNNHVTFLDQMLAVELRGSHHVAVIQNQFDGASYVLLPQDGSTDYHVS